MKHICRELKAHAPSTVFGALTGIAIMAVIVYAKVPRAASEALFWVLHPLHVLLSVLVTTGMHRLHGKRKLWSKVIIGYVGSIGIATLSDSIIPFLGEWLVGLPRKGMRLAFIEK